MVSTIASPKGTPPTGGTVTSAGLDAQMQRYQRQLSDYVYAPTAKTPEGKAAIDKVNEKISLVKLQIEAAEAQRFTKDAGKVALAGETPTTSGATETVGNNINTFA
jgi:hypothetical protein